MATQLEDKHIELTDSSTNPSGEYLRQDYKDVEHNFWNQPFPDDLKTISGNTARFNKTYKKTHTNLFKRKCKIQVELELSNGSTQIIEIGVFLISKVTSNDDRNSVTLTLDDLAKPLMSKSAENVKSGFQWYRNVPLKMLVEELIKQEYFDDRNGEVPRNFIINGIRPKSSTADPILSSLGKPPVFTRIYTNMDTSGICRVIEKADLDGDGVNLYLGIDNKLWRYDELNQVYYHLGMISGSTYSKEFNIKKLWFNNATETYDRYIYGVAWPEEELINDEMKEINPHYQYSCPIGNEFIIFRANNNGITILYDSSNQTDFQNKFQLKLFSGEYHVVPPYFVGKLTTQQEYRDQNDNEFVPIDFTWHYMSGGSDQTIDAVDKYPYIYQILTGIGRNSQTYNNPTIKKSAVIYYPNYFDNIAIPFAQKIGLMCNTWFNNFLESRAYAVGDSGDPKFRFGFHCACSPHIFYDSTYYDNYLTHRYTSGVLHIRNPKSLTQNVDRVYRFGDDIDTSFYSIIQSVDHPYVLGDIQYTTYWYNGATPDDIHIIYTGRVPSLNYDDTQTYITDKGWQGSSNLNSYIPLNTTDKKFHPGYFACQMDAASFPEFPLKPHQNLWQVKFTWLGVPWPWLKYTSGQIGAITFLPNYSTAGGIFIPVLDKNKTIANPNAADVRRRCITQLDLAPYETGDADPLDLHFRYFVYDIATGNFHEKTELASDSGDAKRLARQSTPDYPIQITAAVADADDNAVYVAGYAYTTKNSDGADYAHTCFLKKIEFDGTNDNVTITDYGISLDSDSNHIITDILIIENDSSTKKIVVSGYKTNAILDSSDFTDSPLLGKCFFLAMYNSSLDRLDTIPTGAEKSLWQYRNLIVSSIEKTIYFVNPMDRTERTTGMRLLKLTYDNSFVFSSITDLGYVSDVVSSDSNELSNLELVQFAQGETEVLFGVSAEYYPNVINKSSGRNYLWKYDSYLSGVIELAEFTGMKVWDAITDLAEAFNYNTGFVGEDFFFIPKSFSSTPDIVIDADLDPVVSIEKIQDYDVKNILRTTPYRSVKGEIEWSIVLIANEELTNDFGRTKLDAALRVTQDDDLSKNLVLKTVNRGSVPSIGESTSLRMAYLIYNSSLNSRLLRDVSASDTWIYLPSFFGESLDYQLKVGDLFLINQTDDTLGETSYITRLITAVDFSKNLIQIQSALGVDFPAYTPCSVIRGFAINATELRNNLWSNDGVTYMLGNIVTWVTATEREVDVASIRNISIGNIIKLGNRTQEFEVTYLEEENPVSGYPRIRFKGYGFTLGTYDMYGAQSDLDYAIIRGYWVPVPGEVIEVGGSKIFVGFESGSTGTLWLNSRGADRIEIKCPGLKLESDSNSTITVVDVTSIDLYGQIEDTIDDNKFVQLNLLEYIARTHLKWKSQPRLIFNVQNLVQVVNVGGISYSLPVFKIINNTLKRFSTVRVISKKYLPRFAGYYVDCYLIEHKYNVKSLVQDLSLRSVNPY